MIRDKKLLTFFPFALSTPTKMSLYLAIRVTFKVGSEGNVWG